MSLLTSRKDFFFSGLCPLDKFLAKIGNFCYSFLVCFHLLYNFHTLKNHTFVTTLTNLDIWMQHFHKYDVDYFLWVMKLMDICAISVSRYGLEFINHKFYRKMERLLRPRNQMFSINIEIFKKTMAWAYRDSFITCIWVVSNKASSHERTPKRDVLQWEWIVRSLTDIILGSNV